MSHAHFPNIEYRPRCDGTGRAYIPQFGNCYSSPIPSGIALVPEFVNLTRVQDWADTSPSPTGIPPYPRQSTVWASCSAADPDCNPGNAPGKPWCGPWLPTGTNPSGIFICASGDSRIDYNCYHPTTGTIDYSICRKLGFKNVQAHKNWHGQFGFIYDAQGEPLPTYTLSGYTPDLYNCGASWDWACGHTPLVSAPNQTKYLVRSGTASYTDVWTVNSTNCDGSSTEPWKDCDGSTISNQSVLVGVSLISIVDKNAGTVTNYPSVSISMTPHYAGGDYSSCGGNARINLHYEPIDDIIASLFGWISLNGIDERTVFQYNENYAGTPHTSQSFSRSETAYSYERTWDYSVLRDATCAGTNECVAEFTLNVGSLSASVSLSQPYTAGDVSSEVVSLLSKWPLNDDVLYPWRTDEFTTIAPSVTRNEAGATAPATSFGVSIFYDGSGNITGAIPNGYEDFNAGFYDGSVRGAPLPKGYRNHFDWRHETHNQCIDEFGGQGWYVETYGAYGAMNSAGDATDTLVPLGATQWTNNYEGGFYFPWGWSQFQGATLTAQKWAEIQVKRPSFNFARPCGEDRYNFDEPTVRCISGVTAGSPSTVTIDTFYQGVPAINTNDAVLVCGTSDTGIDGGWKVTKLSDNDYQLSQRLFSFPSGFVSPRDCEFGIFGKIRFPSAPAICGKVKVIGASNAAPIVLGLAEDVWLRDGDRFFVQGVSGNSAANGYQTALVRGPREIALSGTSGNGNYSAGGFAFSPFAVDEKWNDTESKGEYSFQTWDFNFRDVGEFVRLSGQYNDPSLSGCAGVTMPDPVRPNAFANGYPSEISNMACGTHCLGYKNCAPSVIAITPNGETWPNAMNHGFGSMGLDSKYGAQWQAQIKQHVTDPLWQPPHKPCINPTVIDEEGDVHPQHVHWLEDDGTCNQDSEDILGDGISTIARRYYPLRPFVESRCDAPADAPLLPQGIYLGCLTFDQLQTLPMPSGIVCGPPNPVGHSDKYPRTTPMPWGWYLRELSCVCGNVRPEFADVYRANGVDCKEEVPPP